MSTGVVLLNFGEPETQDRSAVLRYLERIFRANADLEDASSEREVRRRSRELAERRVSGLLEEYREIGGSPLNEQARAQARRLGRELERRGRRAEIFVGMQFTEPEIGEAIAAAREAGVDTLVGLPVYPLCGRSTTVAALDSLDRALEESGWEVRRVAISGWHRHPDYLRLRADRVSRYCRQNDLSLTADDTQLVFSAHGTPLRYLDDGNRYDLYVSEYCRDLAARLDDVPYLVGFQNHGNRRVEWTEPEIDEVVAQVEADRIVLEPVSFMHEQSETLSELDVELREVAESAGMEFHRVPVPHDDERFPGVLADLVEAALAEATEDGPQEGSSDRPAGREERHFVLGACSCRPTGGTLCLNSVDQPSWARAAPSPGGRPGGR